MKIKTKTKGFTLVELIVVIAVIMVLAGLLMPKFAAYQAKANETKAINTAKQIQTAAMTSYSEKNGIFEKAAVESAVSLLTQAGTVTGTVDATGKQLTVDYKSDSDSYKTVIKDDSTFIVSKGSGVDETQIYPKQ